MNINNPFNQIPPSLYHINTVIDILVERINELNYPITIDITSDKNNQAGNFIISGSYDDYNITCTISHSADVIDLTGSENERFVHDIHSTIEHELRHHYQNESRIVEPVYDKEYLEQYDEIDAYAVNITLDLLKHDDPLEILKNFGIMSVSDQKSISLDLWAYYSGNQDTLRKLLKKITININNNKD